MRKLYSLSYDFSGSPIPAGLLSGVKIPFDKTGRIANLRLPQLSLNHLQIRNLTLSGADLLLVIGLQNPNSLPFKIGRGRAAHRHPDHAKDITLNEAPAAQTSTRGRQSIG